MLTLNRETFVYSLEAALDMAVGWSSEYDDYQESYIPNTLRAVLSDMVRHDAGAPDYAAIEISANDDEILVEIAWFERS